MILGGSQHFQPHFSPLQAKFQVNSVHYLHSILKKAKVKAVLEATQAHRLFVTSTKTGQKEINQSGVRMASLYPIKISLKWKLCLE